MEFEKSEMMVTYLVAFIVCDFQQKKKEENGTMFSVIAPSEQIERGDYALNLSASVTDFFTYYYNIPFPLPKQDMIAIPDFSAGAMENWGLITYRETALLYQVREQLSHQFL